MGQAARRRRRPAVEPLEDRTVPALTRMGPSEFPVNTTPTGDQDNVATAADANGNFVVVWQSAGQDGSGLGIFARLFNAQGDPQGNEIPVTNTTVSDQANPSVAMDADGDFVVAWQGTTADNSDDIFVRRFDAAGQPKADEVTVNTNPGNNGLEQHPQVAIDANGDFVVVWDSSVEVGVTEYTESVVAQRFNAAGQVQGDKVTLRSVSDVVIRGTTFGGEAVAMDPGGTFVVAWQESSAATDFDIFAQRFNFATGTELDVTPFRVNTTLANAQTAPAVGVDAAGNFVIVWQGRGQDNPDEDEGLGVFGQRFTAAGAAQGGEFQVNVSTTGHQQNPSLAVAADGSFAVAWDGPDEGGSPPTTGQGVYLRQFNPHGLGGDETLVNQAPQNAQRNPAVVLNSAGDTAFVAWDAPDSNGTGVFAQGFTVTAVPDPPPPPPPVVIVPPVVTCDMVNITGLVSVFRSQAKKKGTRFTQRITIVNTSGRAFPCGIALAVDSLKKKQKVTARLMGAQAKTTGQLPAGSPVVILPVAALEAGQSVTVTLTFKVLIGNRPTFTLRVLAGAL